MLFDIDDLKREARIHLDLNIVNSSIPGIDTEDTLSVDDIIVSKLPLAARHVITVAPRYLLDNGVAFGDTIGWTDNVGVGKGVVKLPDDFLRLVSFQMSDWQYPVVDVIDETHPLYIRQQSKVPGIAGNPERPVVAITQQPIGQVLEFWSCEAGESVTLKRARYIPIPKITDRSIAIPAKLKDPSVLYCASLTARTLSLWDNAKALEEETKTLLNL